MMHPSSTTILSESKVDLGLVIDFLILIGQYYNNIELHSHMAY